MDLLHALFHYICGQPPDRTWMPGGVMLPVCQRCTGLYIGAALALGLRVWLRPQLNPRFLALHGVFLLGMAPFGLHWIEHGPTVRTITGLLFGAGVVVFLSAYRLPMNRPFLVGRGCCRASPPNTVTWLGSSLAPPGSGPMSRSVRHRERSGDNPSHGPATQRRAAGLYFLALGVAVGAVPALCVFGGEAIAILFAAAIAAGGLCLAVLVLLNGLAFGVWLARHARCLAVPASA